MSIEKINQGDQLSQSADLVNDNIDKLKMLFPEIVTEGRIDFKALQQVLGEELEEEEEFFRFTWAGKSQARREAHKPSTGTLRPAKEESLDWDTTQNMYIEGDNLEVLKLLQKSYAGKIKVIYIDPPYNTGKDFVYKDNYKDNLKNYQEVTGQIDSDGNKLSTNSDSDGRFHSNWLNMMYPRLRLARNLLSDDGVLFVSIDDGELENLNKILSEIYGEDNFIGQVSVSKGTTTGQDANKIGSSVDYLLIFSKNQTLFELNGLPMSEKDQERFSYEDEKGKYSILQFRKTGSNDRREDRPNLYYGVTDPNGKEVFPIGPSGYDSCWRTSKESYEKWVKENIIVWKEDKNGEYKPYVKYYLEGRTKQVPSLWNDIEGNKKASITVKNLFNSKVFDFPKPVELVDRIITISNVKDGDIILDFFSGSATSAQSTLEYSVNNNTKLRFIQVQLPENTEENTEAYKSGYFKITEIGKERIRRVGNNLKDKNPLLKNEFDLGFKVFKLDSSNIKSWDGNPENLNESLFDAVGNIKTDRTEEDVLYEILLKYGLDLTLPIEERIIEDKKVFNVGLGSLFICLSDNITAKVAEGIGQWKEACSPEICRVIFKDNGFTDVEKTNSVQTLKRYGINEIKSI
mgnify:CR=1 FL=1